MDISRKEFFRTSFMSICEAVSTVSNALKESTPLPEADTASEDLRSRPPEELVAVAENGFCLARSCGCFSCMERCETGAITLIPGVGIRIDPLLCNGCGVCEDICPTTPKGARMSARKV